jgi:hypothetical protein
MSEFGLLVAIAFAGWLFISSFGMMGWGAVPLSFIAGTFLIILAGFTTIVTGLPTRPWVVLCITLVVAAGFFAIRRGWQDKPVWITLAAGIAILFPLAMLFREANLVKFSLDSFRYLLSAGLLANDHYELAPTELLERRLVSAPVVHSMARTYGESYLQAFSPALSLALVAFLAWTVQQAGKGAYASAYIKVVVGLTVLLFLTNDRMIFNAFYINQHLIFGVALVAVCVASYLIIRGDSDSVEPLFAVLLLAVPVLVVTRAEGFIAAGLALLPLILDARLSVRRRLLVLAIYGSATFLWFGYVSLAAEMSVLNAAPAAAGLVIVALGPALPWPSLVKVRRRLLLMVEVGLWFALAVFVVGDPATFTRSLQAFFENVAIGAGGWGFSLLVLGVLGVIALVASQGAALVALRFPLISFVPVFFVLAYPADLREGGYGVGPGDSLNRMLMQFVPLLILYLGVAVLDWSTKSEGAARLAGLAPAGRGSRSAHSHPVKRASEDREREADHHA